MRRKQLPARFAALLVVLLGVGWERVFAQERVLRFGAAPVAANAARGQPIRLVGKSAARAGFRSEAALCYWTVRMTTWIAEKIRA